MASYTSTQDGEWDDVATWGGGGYPDTDGDDVTISVGHTVTYSISADAQIGAIDIYGTLTFAPSANTLLRSNYNNGYIIIRTPTGVLSVGTSAAPIHKDYTCKLTTVGTSNANHGFSIHDGGVFNVYGDSEYYGGITYSRLAVSGDGGYIITLEDDVSGWNVGDEIIIHNHQTFDNDNWYTNYTLTTIIGISGTSVQCSDVISTDYAEGGLVQHLTRNVKIYREGYRKVLDGVLPANDGDHFQINSDPSFINNIFNFYDVEIGSCYRISQLYSPIFNGAVLRNSYYFLINCHKPSFYNCNFNKFRYMQYTTRNCYYDNCTMSCNANNVFVFSYGGKCVDCIFPYYDYIVYSSSGFFTFTRCELTGNFTTGESWEVRFIDCAFPGMNWGTLNSLTRDIYFHNCKFGYDLADREIPVNFMWYYAWGEPYFNNCKFQSESGAYRNNESQYYCKINIKNYNQVDGDDRILLNKATIYTVDADGTDDNPTQRSNGEEKIYKIETLSESDKSRTESFLRHKFYVSNIIQKTIRYYIQTDYTSGLKNNEVVLECIYPTTSSVDTQTITGPIATRANQSDWSQYLEVTFIPDVAGWVELELFVGTYEAGKYIWVDTKPQVI